MLVLIKWLGSGKYTKSIIFTAPIFQNDAPACIITPSGSSRGALLALFGTLSRATQPEYVGIYRSAFVFRSSRLYNNTFWTRRFPLFRARGLSGPSWGTFGELPGELLGTLGELLGSSGRLLGSSWVVLGRSWELLGGSWVPLGGEKSESAFYGGCTLGNEKNKRSAHKEPQKTKHTLAYNVCFGLGDPRSSSGCSLVILGSSWVLIGSSWVFY